MLPAQKPIKVFRRINLDGNLAILETLPKCCVVLDWARQQQIVDVDRQQKTFGFEPERRWEVPDRLSAKQRLPIL